MKCLRSALIAAAGLLVAVPAAAAQFVYPLQGQSPGAQASDEADCARRAMKQSGFDPSTQSYAPRNALTGTPADTSASPLVLGAIHGGLQGGAAGAIGGGGPGEAGAATDAMVHNAGHVAGREGTGGAAEARRGSQSEYDRARADCLTDRGYSVH